MSVYVHTQYHENIAVDVIFSSSPSEVYLFKSAYKEFIDPAITIMKSLVPPDKRSYQPLNKVWTIDYNYWKSILAFWQKANLVHAEHSHADLIAWIENRENKVKEPPPPKVEDFFHQQVVSSSNLSLTSIQEKLSLYLNTPHSNFDKFTNDELSTFYKKAVRKYHPDLNGGDHSKMSELNMLWQEYKNVYQAR